MISSDGVGVETQMSRIWLNAVVASGDDASAVLPMRIRAVIRDGCERAMRRAIQEPMEMPTIVA